MSMEPSTVHVEGEESRDETTSFAELRRLSPTVTGGLVRMRQ